MTYVVLVCNSSPEWPWPDEKLEPMRVRYLSGMYPLEEFIPLLRAPAGRVGMDRAERWIALTDGGSGLEDWASANGISFSSRAELIGDPKVQALYDGIIEGINQNLARFEKLKRVLLVADEFSPGNGALTPTLKLRRRAIEERYRKQIDEMYKQAEVAHVP